jgi:hypothetical protein
VTGEDVVGLDSRAASRPSEDIRCEYVLPVRWDKTDPAALAELTAYLADLSRWVDVTVVDNSRELAFAAHRRAWGGTVRVLRPERRPGLNGKVVNVLSGLAAARHEHVIIADDDVRWTRAGLERAVRLLDHADLVRPQNVFSPLPWHARWDTGRILLNRAVAADHPGTLAVRRSTFLAMGGYDPDVLFENLELSRTVRAYGGVEVIAADLFVRRRPPSMRHFLGQRVRQAYDDLAQPPRLLAEAAVLPVLTWAAAAARSRVPARRRYSLVGLAGGALAVIGLAELGRRRAGGRAVFPATAAFWAPAWLLERALCVWIALARRLRGGTPYAGGRLRVAAHSTRELRRRLAARAEAVAAGAG